MPQRITRAEDFTVFFRVRDRYQNVRLNLLDRGNVIYTARKPRMTPGEMESIRMRKEFLHQGAELKLELEPEQKL